jgi:hypothetical protein
MQDAGYEEQGMYCGGKAFAEGIATASTVPTCFRIGDVDVSVHGQGLDLSLDLQQFLTPVCAPDVDVSVHWSSQIHPSCGEAAFDSGAVWKLSREDDDFVFDFTTPNLGPAPYKQLRTSDFISTRMTLNRAVLDQRLWPLEYPADELLITNYLARYGLGAEVHGCGLVDAGSGGHLFLGHSGAGKSTTARLWKSARNPEILSDDRIILRIHDGELWMYGTPWHGEAGFASPACARLARIFILKHGQQNQAREMRRAEATAELFARCFPPFHSSEGLENTVVFLERVAETVPCYEFQFVPDEAAVDAALNFPCLNKEASPKHFGRSPMA